MKIAAIILSHFKEREGNLKRIVDDLLGGTVVPQKVIIFIDSSDITFVDDRVTIIRSSRSFLPMIRFAIGSMCDTDYCFFLDDDLSVRKKTLDNFVKYPHQYPNSVLGFEGSILGKGETPYSNDTPIRKPDKITEVDIVIRTYFAPIKSLLAGLSLRQLHPDLPNKSSDDVFLCLGNKYLLSNHKNYVIPVDEETGLIELSDGGVGQSYSEDHYKNRNIVCRKLMDIYE